MDRRVFLGWTAAAAARVAGANEQLRGGVIGSGGRGRYLTGEFKELGAPVVAVCDVYEVNLEAGLKAASEGARGYGDYRRLLEDKELDFVIIATPDHWHAQMMIDAVEAGKDVYLEKPLAHTVEEGFRMMEAVRKTQRIVQVGTQRRSAELFWEARAAMQEARMGEVRLVNAWWYNHQRDLNRSPLSGKLDWEKWLGGAPKREFDPVRFLNWYYFWDYSGGMMVGQAAHAVDAIHWFMNAGYPLAVTCAAGRINLAGAEVPESTCLCIEYPENFLAVFTVGYKAMRYHPFHDQLTQYHGSEGRFDVGRESFAYYPQSNEIELKPERVKKAPGSFAAATRQHIRNFLECMRSRQQPTAMVETAQTTNVVLCMAMEALRRGARVRWNARLRQMEF